MTVTFDATAWQVHLDMKVKIEGAQFRDRLIRRIQDEVARCADLGACAEYQERLQALFDARTRRDSPSIRTFMETGRFPETTPSTASGRT